MVLGLAGVASNTAGAFGGGKGGPDNFFGTVPVCNITTSSRNLGVTSLCWSKD